MRRLTDSSRFPPRTEGRSPSPSRSSAWSASPCGFVPLTDGCALRSGELPVRPTARAVSTPGKAERTVPGDRIRGRGLSPVPPASRRRLRPSSPPTCRTSGCIHVGVAKTSSGQLAAHAWRSRRTDTYCSAIITSITTPGFIRSAGTSSTLIQVSEPTEGSLIRGGRLLLGAWNLDGRRVASEPFEEGLRRLAHRVPDGCTVWRDGSVVIGALLSGSRPSPWTRSSPSWVPLARSPSSTGDSTTARTSSRSSVGVDGRWGDRRRMCRSSWPSTRRLGGRFIDLLAGDFALAIYHPERRVVLLGRDALGVVRSTTTEIVGSPSSPPNQGVLADPRVNTRPNDDLVVQWLVTCGLRRNLERAFFRDVFSVPPSNVVVITPDGASKRRYWDFDTDAEDSVAGFRSRVRGGVPRTVRRCGHTAHAERSPRRQSLSAGSTLPRSRASPPWHATERGHAGRGGGVLVRTRGLGFRRAGVRAVRRGQMVDGARTSRDVPGGLVGDTESDIAWAVESPLSTPVPNMVVDLFAASREMGLG